MGFGSTCGGRHGDLANALFYALAEERTTLWARLECANKWRNFICWELSLYASENYPYFSPRIQFSEILSKRSISMSKSRFFEASLCESNYTLQAFLGRISHWDQREGVTASVYYV